MLGKTQRGVSKRTKESKNSLIPKWLGSVVIIVLLVIGTIIFMLWKPWAPVQPHHVQEHSASELTQEETNQDYRFYDQLPKQQVTPIPEQAVPTSQAKPNSLIIQAPHQTKQNTNASEVTTTPSVKYFLQIKSFQDLDSADAKRSEILMNKLPADVITTVEQHQTWYRVVSGPYTSQEAAMLAQQTLQNSGIDSIIIKN